MQIEIRQVIENNHLFEGLRPDLVKNIASSATRKTIGAGEILFQKGDPADALWGVLSGRIVTEVVADDGKGMVLDDFGEGEVFGEVGVIDFGPRRVEARAIQESELFRLERKHFLKHLQSSPELCFRVFSLLCSHLRHTTENLEDTALYKLPSRLARRLTLLAADSLENDRAVLHIVQSDLASMLGVNREAVNRHLKVFENDGLITLGRQRIEIVDQPALAELASPGQKGHQGEWGIEKLAALQPGANSFDDLHEDTPTPQNLHMAGLMAIDAAEYSRSLMTDAAGTLKRIEAGLKAVDQAIGQYQGHTVWHTGDRVLAEFPDANLAMQAALAIQEQVNPAGRAGKNKRDSLFRIGVHYGEVLAGDNRFLGESVNTVIRLTQLPGAGGIAISGAVRDIFENNEQLELQFLGDHELKNVPGKVSVYSARTIPIFKMLVLRAETLVPKRFHPAAVGAAVIVLLAGIWFAGDRMGRQNAPLTVSQTSIAVLPFTSSGDKALDYLAQGIPEEVRTELSTLPGMRVIGRESSGYFSERKTSVAEIGRTLEVAWLLRGSIESVDDEIHATAQFLNAATSELVWEEHFRESRGAPAGFGQNIVHRIAVSLEITDGDGAVLPGLAPLSTYPEAQALYHEAQGHIWRGRGRDVIKAVPLLQTAVELDPSFAEAHAVLAGLYLETNLLDRQEEFNPELRRELSRQSLQQALYFKPDSPLVLGQAAQVSQSNGDNEGALALAERALRTDPNNTAALWARFRVEWGQEDWVSALQTSEWLMRLEPLSVNAMSARSYLLGLADRHQQALSIANRTLAFYPESEVPYAHSWVADCKLKLGDRLGAIDSSRKGMPYGAPVDLWTGLEYDWEFFDDLDPVRSAVGLVYIEEYDQIRQILIDIYNAVKPNSTGAKSQGYLTDLGYLVNRGELEALAGDFESSIEFFERARLLTPVEEGGLVKAKVSYSVLDWSRQSHFSLALLFAYRKSGEHEKAEVIAEQFEDLVAERIEAIARISDLADYQYLYKQAQYHAIEGRSDEALEKLRTWVDYNADIFTYIKWDPFLESLRGDPQFEAIVAEVEAELAEIRAQYHAKQVALIEAEP